jgi:hypothetical protein
MTALPCAFIRSASSGSQGLLAAVPNERLRSDRLQTRSCADRSSRSRHASGGSCGPR